MKYDKPYVICHMISTINGKILPQNWDDLLEKENLGDLYEKYHQRLGGDAWLCGRKTMEIDFTDGELPKLPRPDGAVDRKLFVATKRTPKFAIAVDSKGSLNWTDNHVNEDSLIVILSDLVSNEYLYFLQNLDISYLVVGRKQIDFPKAFHILHTEFGIERLLLEGGGHINGSLYDSGLVNELSLLVVPVIDTTPNTPTVFEQAQNIKQLKPYLTQLKRVEHLDKGVLWLNYSLSN